jgi:hypothetical protein
MRRNWRPFFCHDAICFGWVEHLLCMICRPAATAGPDPEWPPTINNLSIISFGFLPHPSSRLSKALSPRASPRFACARPFHESVQMIMRLAAPFQRTETYSTTSSSL